MADFMQQLINMLVASYSLVIENITQERIIPTADGSRIVVQQRKDVERQIKTLPPQLDFTGVNVCRREQIKLIIKRQLLPGIPFNIDNIG